jgi:hypothetical protein
MKVSANTSRRTRESLGSTNMAQSQSVAAQDDPPGRPPPPPWCTLACGWFQKAVEAAQGIEAAHTAPWKLASTSALLAIAEAQLAQAKPKPTGTAATTDVGHPTGELLNITDVAAMTRLSVGTLRYWRHTGSGGPPSVTLGRRVLYRRADVETWLKEAR